MEAEAPIDIEQEQPPPPPPSPSSSSVTYKLVPWLSWYEWDSVRASLFSPAPDSVASALRRINSVEKQRMSSCGNRNSPADFEIQLKDPFSRKDLPPNAFFDSDEILAMLYCMATMRLVNGVIEKT